MDMFDRQSLIQRLKELALPEKEYWVVAGGAMVLHGFRPQTRDIDLGCSSFLADKLEQQGYCVSRIPVVCVDGLIQMKKKLGREKDLTDIAFIKKPAKSPMIVLSGPTAVGKTKLSIALAKALNGEVLSADSMQVYRHMDIGSAKITQEEMQGVPHHMIDILEPWEEFSVAVFKEKCEECLSGIYARGHIPIVTGGTGFYVQALLRNIDFTATEGDDRPCTQIPSEKTEDMADSDLSNNGLETKTAQLSDRSFLEALAEEKGALYLHEMLKEIDPASAESIHPNNRKRVIRALEYFYLTGEPISRHNEKEREKEPAYNACYFVLNDVREKIYSQIDKRVDQMLEKGLVAEVEKLRAMGCHRGMVSMQGLGYKEILAYLEGEGSLEEAVETIKRNTRHFAKRQLTWFRREKDVIWLNKETFGYDEERILEYILKEMQTKGIQY